METSKVACYRNLYNLKYVEIDFYIVHEEKERIALPFAIMCDKDMIVFS